jgi:hypothetical protein
MYCRKDPVQGTAKKIQFTDCQKDPVNLLPKRSIRMYCQKYRSSTHQTIQLN